MEIRIDTGDRGKFGAKLVDESTGEVYFVMAGRFSEEHRALSKAQRANLGLPIYSTTGVRVG